MKRRLRKWVRVTITILTIILSIGIYVLMANLGELATQGIIYQVALICGWCWLLFVQPTVYFVIWERELNR